MNGILSIFMLLLGGHTVTVEVQEIRKTVTEYIISRIDSTERKDAMVEFRGTLSPVTVDGERYALRVDPLEGESLRGFVTVRLEIVSQGKVQRTLALSLKVRVFGEALFTARQFDRHVVLQQADVASRAVEITDLPDDFITRFDQLDGQRTSRIVEAGCLLRKSILEQVPLVYRDEPVTLIVRAGTVRLSVEAIAREDGIAGKTIEVQKKDSHERIRAVVVDEHTVQVTAE
ncbi:MAG TPA: flagellar basal body P-ring formation chaperone FlgA [Bacteroidota bacterium]|nr:flagellar basal body P-ring formation chaperone FlgA [Bacteroidota bacterium]